MCGRGYLPHGGQEKETRREMCFSRRDDYFWYLGHGFTNDYGAKKITPSYFFIALLNGNMKGFSLYRVVFQERIIIISTYSK